MRLLQKDSGFTLIELLTVLFLFSIVMAGLYSAYTVQLRQGVKEYRVAESEMDIVIARNVIERDISMAGYGLADDYDSDNNGIQDFTPMVASATEGSPDTLTLRGTAIARLSRSTQGWSYLTDVTLPTVSFKTWSDARENVRDGDAVIVMEPANRKFWADGSVWLFKIVSNPSTTAPNTLLRIDGSATNNLTLSQKNYLFYGLYTAGSGSLPTQPYSAVRYSLGGTSPSVCAPGTQSLLRAESRTSNNPSGGDPILNCVLDIQVAFGLDDASTDGNGPVSLWDNGGVRAAQYASITELKKRLKQVRMYVLVQQGNRDTAYTYRNPDPDPAYFGTSKIRVGEWSLPAAVAGGVGQDVVLTAEQERYRWRVVSFVVTPRNIR